MLLNRRQALLRTLFGPSGVGLVSFATGIPVSILCNPRKGLAASSETCPSSDRATFLILSTSSDGDPLNCNVPGTYDDPNIVHSPDPALAAKTMTLGNKQVKAASVWANADPEALAQTSFFHHNTNTVVHADEPITLRIGNTVANGEMLVSLLASQLAPCLGTIQTQPVIVGGTNTIEMVYYKGRAQPRLRPRSLANVLTAPNGPLKDLRPLRDQSLDALNRWYKQNATQGQSDFLDRYAKSQTQLRNVSDQLLGNLASIKDDGTDSQMTASIALFMLNIAPVSVVKIAFGNDNHGDNNLAQETKQTIAGVASYSSLYQKLKAAGLTQKVTFASINVFGRTMAARNNVQNGRDHNPNHHVTVMMGPRIKSGVVGGVVPLNGDYGATAIDSASGAGNAGGDIAFSDTFSSMAKTLGSAVGLSSAYLDSNVKGGKIVTGALNA